MRTPGHAVVNLALIAPMGPPALAAGALLGAIVPDLPILCLYLCGRASGAPLEEIWRERYQRPGWLATIHGFHSVPLAALGLLLAWLAGSPPLIAFFASALLHDALDVPLHTRDAHRHLFPLSDYRFVSPFSYWDVTRHAKPVTALEWLGVAVASAVLARGASREAMILLTLVELYYAASFARLFRAPAPAA